jgi:hypothetical protein
VVDYKKGMSFAPAGKNEGENLISDEDGDFSEKE